MSYYSNFTGQYVDVELSGSRHVQGYLIDSGLDIIAISQFDDIYYIPLKHVQCISASTSRQGGTETDIASSIHPFQAEAETISFRKVLLHARGHFAEINITENATIHGYLTSIMNDFFVFHSPVYRTVFITLNHLKWIQPYKENVTPYALDPESIPHHSVPSSLPRTFKEQCQKFCGKLVVFDMGDHPNKIGKLQSVDTQTNVVEIITANGSTYLWNLDHLKVVFLP